MGRSPSPVRGILIVPCVPAAYVGSGMSQTDTQRANYLKGCKLLPFRLHIKQPEAESGFFSGWSSLVCIEIQSAFQYWRAATGSVPF